MQRSLFRRTAAQVLWWSPVWAPLALAAQLALRGLEPARHEKLRLEGEVPAVVERHRRSQAKIERLEAESTAWQDPVYIERVRRARAAGRPEGG